MNLLNTFLYMANYNLVIPFVSALCDQLGVEHSQGGIIVGVADISAMIAAIFYSSWTNHSFRHPLLFSALTLLVSNILYSLSLDYGGLWLLIAARLLSGFGAARSLNRRYIADFVGVEWRTLASAGTWNLFSLFRYIQANGVFKAVWEWLCVCNLKSTLFTALKI